MIKEIVDIWEQVLLEAMTGDGLTIIFTIVFWFYGLLIIGPSHSNNFLERVLAHCTIASLAIVASLILHEVARGKLFFWTSAGVIGFLVSLSFILWLFFKIKEALWRLKNAPLF